MKKYIITAVFVAIMAQPSPIYAQTAAGIEFQTPLVQQIVQLLHDRIAELNNKIEELRAQKTITKTVVEERVVGCEPVGAAGPSRKDRIYAEYRTKISGVDRQIQDLRNEKGRIEDEYRKYKVAEISDATEQAVMDWSGHKGGLPDDLWRSGHFNLVMDYYTAQIEGLRQERQSLEAERNSKL